MVHDRKASEDIVQDVFLALWERREEVDFDRPLLPLLFVAVKNRAIDLLRSKKWRGGESGQDELDVCIRTRVADHIEEEFQLSQLSEEIDFCISELSEQCRRVFLLSRTTGLKNREIAEQLNISVKTVEKHIGAALSKLRLRLSRSGFLRLFLWKTENALYPKVQGIAFSLSVSGAGIRAYVRRVRRDRRSGPQSGRPSCRIVRSSGCR